MILSGGSHKAINDPTHFAGGSMNTICHNFIGGDLIPVNTKQFSPVYNPSRGEVIAQAPESDEQAVDLAVQAARKALPAWADTPVGERARVMLRFAHRLDEDLQALARMAIR